MLTILHPGLLSTLQDGGRHGSQAIGVTPGGAVDDVALSLGNLLLGNAPTATAIEMTWQGMDVCFDVDCLIALTGAPLLTREDEQRWPLWRPLWVRAGARLSLGRMPQGARSYLCVQGGWITPEVLGGTGTDVRNGIGGHCGRPLKAGDTLDIAPQQSRYPGLHASLLRSEAPWVTTPWQLSMWRDWWLAGERRLPVLVDADMADSPNLQERWWDTPFLVLPQSDRQGLRLKGGLAPRPAERRRSAGACFGMIQLPPDGRPIVLLADHQTTGGYPVMGVVAATARAALAQARPGDMLRLLPVSLAEAHAALWQRELRWQYMQRELRWRMHNPP